VQINFYNGRAIGVEIPPSVVLTVVDTEPGIRNATATNTFKPAKMDTGITVQVPPFINKGEKIKVDTAEGKYMERASPACRPPVTGGATPDQVGGSGGF
ncbi:MAG: hypothetical protein ACT4P3_15070, partial [Betaproteobacteria bacterium]